MHYEILLRGDKDGNLKGAHVLETHTSIARPIKDGDWPAIVAGINEATLTKASSSETEISDLKNSHEIAINDLKTAHTEALSKKDSEWKAKLDTSNDKNSTLSQEITELKSEIAELKKNHGVAINDLKAANADKATEKDAEWKAKLDTANDKVSELSKEIVELKKTIEEGKSILLTHQTETDRGMAIAGPLVEKLVETGDPNALSLAQVFAQFALYSSAREDALKLKQLEELEAQKKAIEDKIAALL